MLKKELGDDYFAELRTHLRQLKFNGGVLLSAELGKGGRSKSYTLRQPHDPDPSWFKRVVTEVEHLSGILASPIRPPRRITTKLKTKR